uniref:MIT domain-containing protein 1 n=1 Tax=Cacopsylla melanoneura TaxID=428564 RepID=A0A8D8VAZ1_9HEMI
MSNSLELAQFLLKKAVDLDEKGRWTESLNFYQEGVTELLKYVRGLPSRDDQQKIREKVETYIGRAEILKQKLDEKKKMGDYHEQFEIKNNDKGYSYESLFGRFLDEFVEHISVTDPYIHNTFQCFNFLHFCTLAVRNCKKLEQINLLTTRANKPQYAGQADLEKQEAALKQISDSLRQNKVSLNITYSNTLHDREIVTSTDWIIKIGRGLDMYHKESEFSLGFLDLSRRRCKETVVDIFHKSTLVK